MALDSLFPLFSKMEEEAPSHQPLTPSPPLHPHLPLPFPPISSPPSPDPSPLFHPTLPFFFLFLRLESELKKAAPFPRVSFFLSSGREGINGLLGASSSPFPKYQQDVPTGFFSFPIAFSPSFFPPLFS